MSKWLVIVIVLTVVACHSVGVMTDEKVVVRVPAGFPPIAYPEGNEPTKLRIQLGRILFYDTRLSADHSTHCGTCHVLSVAFTDSKETSTGMAGFPGRRNSPTLANIAYVPRLMMEGGVPTLETQALAPLHDTLEMGFNLMHAVHELNKDATLKAMARAAYGRDTIDPFVVTRALAAFQRTILSGDSHYDQYKQGQLNQMNEKEVRGMNLFFSEKTKCSECHSGVFLTDFDYHNIGLETESVDHGKERASNLPQDIGKFKTPTLRNIALTAPYMHDGRYNSLEEVITFYNAGGVAHVNKDTRIQPLQLTSTEQKELIAFLGALTDWNFVQNQQLLPLMK